MKKLILIFLILALMICLVGCDETTTKPIEPQAPKAQTELTAIKDSKINIWTDPETGVQYIIYRDGSGYCGFGGITPRLNADGTLYTEDGE